MTEISLSKQSSLERVGEPFLNLDILRNPLSISSSQSGESDQFEDFISELSIRLSKVSLYLLGIAAISEFFFISLTTYLNICF